MKTLAFGLSYLEEWEQKADDKGRDLPASMSKPITTVAVMMMLEEGKIRSRMWQTSTPACRRGSAGHAG